MSTEQKETPNDAEILQWSSFIRVYRTKVKEDLGRYASQKSIMDELSRRWNIHKEKNNIVTKTSSSKKGTSQTDSPSKSVKDSVKNSAKNTSGDSCGKSAKKEKVSNTDPRPKTSYQQFIILKREEAKKRVEDNGNINSVSSELKVMWETMLHSGGPDSIYWHNKQEEYETKKFDWDRRNGRNIIYPKYKPECPDSTDPGAGSSSDPAPQSEQTLLEKTFWDVNLSHSSLSFSEFQNLLEQKSFSEFLKAYSEHTTEKDRLKQAVFAYDFWKRFIYDQYKLEDVTLKDESDESSDNSDVEI